MLTPGEGDTLVPPPQEGPLRASGHFLQSSSRKSPNTPQQKIVSPLPQELTVYRGHSLLPWGHESCATGAAEEDGWERSTHVYIR